MKDEETSEKPAPEALADIVRELRHDAEVVEKDHDEDTWSNWEAAEIYRDLADRIEAAAKNMENAFGMALAIEDGLRKRDKQSSPGNAAAMREALDQCELFLGNVSRHGHPTLNPGDKCTACNGVDELRSMVVQALAAPARNCDRFTTAAEATRAFQVSRGHAVFADACLWDDRDKIGAFIEWLFAPAEGKEADNG